MTGPLTRPQIAWRIAQDIEDGMFVNLGIGMPELVANYIPIEREIIIHSENGLLGMGAAPNPGAEDGDLINAGKKPVSIIPGGSYCHHTDSFAMIRGGHIDVCVLGAFQVSENGDLANWATNDDSKLPAVGGAMDLAVGAKSIFVITTHCDRDGAPKLLDQCAYPLTGHGVVKSIYTDLAVIDITNAGFEVREFLPEISFEDLQSKTGANLVLAKDCKPLIVPDLGKQPNR